MDIADLYIHRVATRFDRVWQRAYIHRGTRPVALGGGTNIPGLDLDCNRVGVALGRVAVE